MIITYRSLLVVLTLIAVVANGGLPWWVLVLLGVYQVPGAFKFLLPSQKRYIKEQVALYEAQQQAVLAKQLNNLKATDIN